MRSLTNQSLETPKEHEKQVYRGPRLQQQCPECISQCVCVCVRVPQIAYSETQPNPRLDRPDGFIQGHGPV